MRASSLIAIPTEAGFWDSFWPALASGILAGVVVAFVAYLLVNRFFGLQERLAREKQIRESTLGLVHGELLHNASQVATCRQELPTMGIPTPGFQLECWNIVTQMPALLTLKVETSDALLHAYNRLRSVDDQLSVLREQVLGRDALTVALTVATSEATAGTSKPPIQEVLRDFQTLRNTTRDALLDRLDDLLVHLEKAIDTVEAELGINAVPASRRLFVHESRPTVVRPGAHERR